MYRCFYIVFLLLGLQISAQRKFEVWNKNQVDVMLPGNFLIKVAEKVHHVPQNNEVDLFYGDVYIGKQIKNWAEVGAGYRLTQFHTLDAGWKSENRPMLYFDLKQPVKNFKLTFYNRFEYRMFEMLSDHFRYRHALKVQFPKLAKWGMQFYTSEEVFMKLTNTGTHLARFYGGIDALTTKRLKISTYYAIQKSKLVSEWIDSEIFGVNFELRI